VQVEELWRNLCSWKVKHIRNTIEKKKISLKMAKVFWWSSFIYYIFSLLHFYLDQFYSFPSLQFFLFLSHFLFPIFIDLLVSSYRIFFFNAFKYWLCLQISKLDNYLKKKTYLWMLYEWLRMAQNHLFIIWVPERMIYTLGSGQNFWLIQKKINFQNNGCNSRYTKDNYW
jgi:hypothetical protein